MISICYYCEKEPTIIDFGSGKHILPCRACHSSPPIPEGYYRLNSGEEVLPGDERWDNESGETAEWRDIGAHDMAYTDYRWYVDDDEIIIRFGSKQQNKASYNPNMNEFENESNEDISKVVVVKVDVSCIATELITDFMKDYQERIFSQALKDLGYLYIFLPVKVPTTITFIDLETMESATA